MSRGIDRPGMRVWWGREAFLVAQPATGGGSRWFRRLWFGRLEHYHPGKANVVADVLSRKSYVNTLITEGLPQKLADDLRELRLEIVPRGYVAAFEIQSTLPGKIREAQKTDKESAEIKERMSNGKAKGFREDDHHTLWFEDRIYVPNDPRIRKLILQDAHDSPYSIHPGSTKMYLDLKESFWWT